MRIRKWLIMAMALLFIFAMDVPAEAPALDMSVNVAVGADVEVVFNKEIELDNLGVDMDMSAQHYDAVVDVMVGDWLKVSPRGGISHLTATADSVLGEVELNSEIGWNLGVDVDARILTTPYADLHFISDYQFTRAGIDKIDVAGVTFDNPFETIVHLHEFEIGGKVSKDLNKIEALKGLDIPITLDIGVVYSNLVGNVNVDILGIVDLDEDIAAKNNVGLRCGLKAEPITDLIISLDAKFIDETSLIAAVVWKF